MGEEKAPFNSALDLLERLSLILKGITKVKQNPFLNQSVKQGFVLELAKDYYVQAIPLLSTEGRSNLKCILDLKQTEGKATKNGVIVGPGTPVYSLELENKINELLIQIQMDLQDIGKYFMPPRKKLGKVVGDF